MSGCLVHEFKPTSGSYKTYRSVLMWVYSSQIRFAPLDSSVRYSTTSDAKLLQKTKSIQSDKFSSPKSVYRLAHYLQLSELSKIALESIESQIEFENVAYELYSDLSKNYEEVRTICLRTASEDWVSRRSSHVNSFCAQSILTSPTRGQKRVKSSQAMKDLQADWEKGVKTQDASITLALAFMF